MIILAIDTALQSCAVALLEGGTCVARQQVTVGKGQVKGHAEILPPMVAEIFANTSITLKDVDRVGVVIGPGGFAGVRVGLAFARGLVLGTKAIAVGINSLQALAANLADPDLIAPVIDARRGQVYAALYNRAGLEVHAPFVATPKQVMDFLTDKVGSGELGLIGTGAALLPEVPDHWRQIATHTQIDPVVLAHMVENAAAPKLPPAPLYLRAPDAKRSTPSRFENLTPV